ncbi:MAG: hypothetical protein IPO22_08875 [Anaerolineales bacterium]|nr:hypothetical protein [Anaerolineales bacterium]
MSDQEQERLKRLREKQLQARDPLVKQRNFQHSSSVKEKRMRKPFSLAKAWKKDIPHIIKAPLYGLLLGVVVIFVLPMLWVSPYAIYAGAGDNPPADDLWSYLGKFTGPARRYQRPHQIDDGLRFALNLETDSAQ